MKLCWLGCGILAVLLALSLLCGMLTQRSTPGRRRRTRAGARSAGPGRDGAGRGGRRAGPAALAAPSPLSLRRAEPRRARRHRAGLCGAAGLFRRGRRSGAAQPLRGPTAAAAAHRAAGRAVCRELSHLPGADLGRLVIPRSEATWESLANDLEFAEVHRNFGPVLQNSTPRVLPRAAPPAEAMQ